MPSRKKKEQDDEEKIKTIRKNTNKLTRFLIDFALVISFNWLTPKTEESFDVVINK